MIQIQPKFLKKDDKDEFAILSIEDYNLLIKYIEELEDLVELRKAKEESRESETYTISEVRKILGVN